MQSSAIGYLMSLWLPLESLAAPARSETPCPVRYPMPGSTIGDPMHRRLPHAQWRIPRRVARRKLHLNHTQTTLSRTTERSEK